MPQVYDTAIDLPENYYHVIGEVLQRWAQLEYQLHEIIWRALGLDNKRGRTLTVGMQFETLNGILRTVTQRWVENRHNSQEIHSILKTARPIHRERNFLAHGSWQQAPDDGNRLCLVDMWATEQRIMPKAVYRTPDELRETAAKLRKLNVRAQRLISRLEKQLPSSGKSA